MKYIHQRQIGTSKTYLGGIYSHKVNLNPNRKVFKVFENNVVFSS